MRCLLLLLTAPVQAQEAQPAPLAWDAQRAEHLLNRAGFGGNSAAVARLVALGPEAAVEELLTVDPWVEEPFYARKRADGDLGKYVRSLPEEEREMRMRELREGDRAQVDDFLEWWVARMLAGANPLRERMVLFWHGHFTSSMEAVKSSYEMIQQNQMFRRHALASFRELLHGVARDPAMLVYLDNTSSKKGHPNENFARELLELYTLGLGNYTEEDVREVARAFTGWSQRNGRFRFEEGRHDKGKKSVLGKSGRLGGAEVVEVLLKQAACARHVAGALLAYFEGREPAPERLASYASELRDSGYRIDGFLRRLFLDPEFYADEVLAARVSSPLDYLVGSARRLGVAPDPGLVVLGASLLGQRLFYPPSVRGWEGGEAWAAGTSLLVRGQLAGLFLGVVSGKELVGALQEERAAAAAEEPPAMDGEASAMEGEPPAMDDEARAKRAKLARKRREKLPEELRELARAEHFPRLNLVQRLGHAGAEQDADLAQALVEECLAIPAPAALVARVALRLEGERARLELGATPWSEVPEEAEPFLRALAHEILASPEAQLD
ncbi:MAG TPA: DUF1800 domain-containing protein [Planctomycetota bacterium]